jgi:hypothetical protein
LMGAGVVVVVVVGGDNRFGDGEGDLLLSEAFVGFFT